MFGELDDSDIYVNNQGDNFDSSSESPSIFSFDEPEEESASPLNSFQGPEVDEPLAPLGAEAGYSNAGGDAVDPFAEQPSSEPKKAKKANPVLVYIVALALLGGAAFTVFQNKTGGGEGLPGLPAANNEAEMGDYFYDKAGGDQPAAGVQAPADSTMATVDVDLTTPSSQNPAAQGANPTAAAAPQAVEQKPLSAVERAMAKKKADDIKQDAMIKNVPPLGKSVTIAVASGGRIDPFLPYYEARDTSMKLDLIAPPMELPPADPILDEVIATKISGIMYEKTRPSAIINFGDADHLVHKGDLVKGYKIIDITKNSVVIKYKSNIYQASVGQTLDEGVNLNQVSNISRQFGGAYSNPRTTGKVIQFNQQDK